MPSAMLGLHPVALLMYVNVTKASKTAKGIVARFVIFIGTSYGAPERVKVGTGWMLLSLGEWLKTAKKSHTPIKNV